MTREEAIEVIRMALAQVEWDYPMDYAAAFDMAIKALEQEPSEDAISRQAALEAFGLSESTRKYGGDHSGYDTMMMYEIQDVIEGLPSVTPQPCEDATQIPAQWQELKETITELRDNDGTGTQQEVCKFLANLMDVLERQMIEVN